MKRIIDQFSDEYQDCVTDHLETDCAFDVISTIMAEEIFDCILKTGQYKWFYTLDQIISAFKEYDHTLSVYVIKGMMKYVAYREITKSFKTYIESIFCKQLVDIDEEDILEHLENTFNEVYLQERNKSVMQELRDNGVDC